MKEIFSDTTVITYQNGQKASIQDFISMNVRRDSILDANDAKLNWDLLRAFSVDIDPKSIEISKKMVRFAGLDNKIQFIEGSASQVIPTLEDGFDFVFIDHGNNRYLNDLLLLEEHSLLNQNAVVFADNVGIFETDLENYLNHVCLLYTSPSPRDS